MVHGLRTMAAINEVASGQGEKPLQVVVANSDIGDPSQALYVDGQRKMVDETIYSCDIAEHTEGKPFVFTHVNIEGWWEPKNHHADWPIVFEELVPYIETSIGY